MRRVRCRSGNELVRATWMRRPHICRDCRKDFSFNTDAVLYNSTLALSPRAIALYLYSANRMSVSSMKSLRVLGTSQTFALRSSSVVPLQAHRWCQADGLPLHSI